MTKWLNLFRRRRDRLERELLRELQYHLDRRVDDLITEGLSEPEARRRASLELGGVPQVQDAVRDTWTWRWLDALVQDLRDAVRNLIRHWGVALGAGAVLTLTIGANVAMFSVVDAVLLQPLGFPDADRLVSIETVWTDTGRSSQSVSGPDFLDWQAHNDVFAKMATYYSGDTGGTNDSPVILGDRATFANPRYVSAEFFAVFGQAPSAGRLLTEDDYSVVQGRIPTAVVRYEWALTQFGSAEAAIGERLTVDGDVLAIVGVAAPGFRFPEHTDLWVPSAPDGDPQSRGNHDLHAVGKLKAGAELARAQAEMRSIGDALARQYPENRLKTVSLTSLQERLTGNLRATLWVLMAAVGVVWLIGCANVANLLLTRAASRTREFAVRAALGAGRGRVVRLLFAESCVLGGVAGVAGLLLALMNVQAIVAFAPASLPRIDGRMDGSVVLFALALSLVSTVICGLIPALHALRLDLSNGLKQGGSRTSMSKAGATFRSAMVVAEVALSVVLLAAAGLLLRSFLTLLHVDLGFTTNRVLVAFTEYTVKEDGSDIPVRIRVFAHVLDRLRAVPGVSAASGVAFMGMGREPRPPRDYFIEGRPEGQLGQRPQAELHAITADYFKTLEIPIVAGRDFAATDIPETPRVAIINQTMARIAFPGQSPIGHRIRVNSRAPWMEIVGVVGDTRWQDPMQPAPPVLYGATTQGLGNSPAILVRTSLDQTSLANTLRALLDEQNPTVPVKVETLDELFHGTLAYPRFRTQVIGLFAGVAALLAAVGIFSVLANLVGQRTRELAVRRALGARAGDVIALIAGQGLRMVAVGLVLGLAGALAVAQLLTGLLHGISSWDVATYLATIAVLGGVALPATLLPAMKAAMVAPVILLQQD